MLEANLTGSAPLKQKTINAEVNLLSEWLRTRKALGEQITRTASVLGLILVMGAGSMPFLKHAYSDADQNASQVRGELERANALLAEKQPGRLSARPVIDQSVMRATVAREAEQFVGNTVLLLNAASAGMAIDVVSADVIGGEMTIHVKADAESNAVIQGFIDQAAKGRNVDSTLLATSSRSETLGVDGMRFEYIKRIKVNQ